MGRTTTALLWRRALARLVDMACVFFVLWFLVVVQFLWFMREASLRFDPAPWGRAFAPLCAFLVLYATYEAVFLRWNAGQTPGRQLLGTRVVTSADGSYPSAGRALLRWLVPATALLVRPLWASVAVLAMTALSVPWSPRRRTVHDLIAGTAVVRYQPAAHEHDRHDEADQAATSESEMSLTMMDVLLGRPGRRPVRGMRHSVPFYGAADRERP